MTRIRGAALVAALLLLMAALVPASHARAAAGTIVPPIDAAGVDYNGDGLYDVLRVNATVNLTAPGVVWLHAELDVGSFYIDGENSAQTSLPTGNHNLTVEIPGWKIRESGWNPIQWTLNLSLMEPDPSSPYAILLAAYSTDIILHVSDYAGPAFGLTGAIASSAVDTNGNGLYDWLQFNATFTIGRDAAYYVLDSLTSGSAFIRGNTTTLAWGEGTHTLNLAFPGVVLRGMNYSGPFQLDLYIAAVIDGFSQTAEYTAQTAAYAATLFEPPPALFQGPISERATDADEDGLYDALVVSVPIHATATATIAVRSYISSTFGSCLGVYDSVDAGPLTVGPGDATFELRYSADVLATCGPRGPYEIDAYLDLRGPGIVNRTTYTTAAYGTDAFEPSASTAGNLVTLHPTDTNGDGRYDLLTLAVPIHAVRAADYFVDLPFWGTNERLDIGRVVHLAPGNTTVFLNVSGINLNRSLGGDFAVLGVVRNLDNGVDVSLPRLIVPSSLNASLYASRPVLTLSGTVTAAADGSPQEYAGVLAFDPTTKFQTRVETDAYGHYALNLYDGTFEILVAGDGDLQPMAFIVTVHRNVTQDFAVHPAPQDPVNYSVRFVSPSEAQVETRESFVYANQSYRLHADLYGNFDGDANASELGLYMAHASIQTQLPPWWNAPLFRPALTSPQIWADKVSFAAGNVTAAVSATSGSVAATDPLELVFTSTYRAQRPLTEGEPHSLQVVLPYSNAAAEVRARILLPPGTVGTITWPGNVSAQSFGPGTWDLLMGQAPTDFDSRYGATVQIALPGPGMPLVWWVIGGVAAFGAVLALLGFLRQRRKPTTADTSEREPRAP